MLRLVSALLLLALGSVQATGPLCGLRAHTGDQVTTGMAAAAVHGGHSAADRHSAHAHSPAQQAPAVDSTVPADDPEQDGPCPLQVGCHWSALAVATAAAPATLNVPSLALASVPLDAHSPDLGSDPPPPRALV